MKLKFVNFLYILLLFPVVIAAAPAAGRYSAPTNHMAKANALAEKGAYDQALNEVDLALQQTPNSARIYSVRGHIYIAKGEYGRALEDLTRVISLVPNQAKPYIDRAIIHFKMNNKGLAVTDITRALQLKPDSAWAQGVRDKILNENP
jgi:tetratricopeptide (TPR) repeat protein